MGQDKESLIGEAQWCTQAKQSEDLLTASLWQAAVKLFSRKQGLGVCNSWRDKGHNHTPPPFLLLSPCFYG